jgi:hypothetical protein
MSLVRTTSLYGTVSSALSLFEGPRLGGGRILMLVTHKFFSSKTQATRSPSRDLESPKSEIRPRPQMTHGDGKPDTGFESFEKDV